MLANPNGKAYKWQVGIVHRVLGYRICGGSIINEQFIITSGNCVQPHNSEDLEVVLEDDLEHHRVAALVPRLYFAYRCV